MFWLYTARFPGIWTKFFLQASRSFLYSSGTLYPSGKRENEGKKFLYKNQTFYCFRLFSVWKAFKGTHELGFGRNLWKIIPTSLPELPIQLRDLMSFRETRKWGKEIYIKNKQSLFRDLYISFQTFGAGSREDFLRRIRIWGPKSLFPTTRVEILRKTKTIKK